jgi:hypothetical protein
MIISMGQRAMLVSLGITVLIANTNVIAKHMKHVTVA